MIIGGEYIPLNIIPGYWGKPAVIKINQFDKELSEMGFTVWNGKEKMDLSGISASIICRKPDNNVVVYDCTVNTEDDSITVPVKEQMSVLAGTVRAELALVDTNGGEVHTWNFSISVEHAVSEDGGVSETEIAVFQEILDDAQAVQATISAIAEDVSEDAEAAARAKRDAETAAGAAESAKEDAEAAARAAQQDFTEIDQQVEVLETGRVYIGPDGRFYCSSTEENGEEEE